MGCSSSLAITPQQRVNQFVIEYASYAKELRQRNQVPPDSKLTEVESKTNQFRKELEETDRDIRVEEEVSFLWQAFLQISVSDWKGFEGLEEQREHRRG
jgi:hypothetical protein